jgi:putative flavoprotein involved in K+ transport
VAQEPLDVVVIGGGQAGLAVGYHLGRHSLRFVILEAHHRVGESWRRRWEALRVFTRARYDGLPGMPFPAPGHSFPTKDEVADFLEAYARQMELPVHTGVRVERLARADEPGGGYVAESGDRRFEAPQVVIATGAYYEPSIPPFAPQLDCRIRQLHSSEYRGPNQLQPGGVLVVGASNSGGEIAFDAAREHRTWLSGRDTGQMPFDINGRVAKLLDPVIWFMANHVLTVDTPMGRKARPHMRSRGAPLERVRPADLAAAGVERVYARAVGARGGLPLLDDGRVMDVANVVWCTGFRHDFPWLDVPVMGEDGWPIHHRGAATTAPGLYFLGLPFLYSFASPLIGGVGRDARYVADRIATLAAAVGGPV